MATPPRVITLSRIGICRECARTLGAGEEAWWAWGRPWVVCLGCRPLGSDPQPAASPVGGPSPQPTRETIPPSAAGARVIALRRAGMCEKCGLTVEVAQRAWWQRGHPLVTCLACRPEIEAVPDATAPPAVDPRADIDAGVAGGSAMREFQRRRETREARIRERWGRLGGLVLALTADPSTTRAWERGSVGESKLAAALGKVGRDDVVFLHDRRVPRTRGNIDHIVVAPSGVYVVDAKRYTGEVRVRDVAGLFSRPDRRLFLSGRDCSRLAKQLGWQLDAVRTALVTREDLSVIPVLCFVDAEWPLLGVPDEFEGVRIERLRTLRTLVTSPGPLTTDEVIEVAVVLSHALPAYAPPETLNASS